MKHFLIIIGFLILSNIVVAQTEGSKIETTILNYVNGTSYNQPELIEKAFYPEANLYLTKNKDELWTVPISEYTSWYTKSTPGKFNGRTGNILSIEYFNNIAMAKAEIVVPVKNTRYIDMFLLKKINNEWKIISKSADSQKSNANSNRILFIVSNAHYYGDSKLPTGNSYSEIVNAYDTFKKAGYTVDFVSPKGGSIPLAYINTTDSLQKKYLYNADFMYALKNTKNPNQINPNQYKAVHYIGGGSAMFGVPENKSIQKIVMTIYEEKKGIISSVCHGTAGIIHLKTKDGKFLVEGKTINGYPDAFEREGAEYLKQFPFLITKTIEEHGGVFKYSPRNSVHVEVDGNVITGQNYFSSKYVALKIIENLNNRIKSN